MGADAVACVVVGLLAVFYAARDARIIQGLLKQNRDLEMQLAAREGDAATNAVIGRQLDIEGGRNQPVQPHASRRVPMAQ